MMIVVLLIGIIAAIIIPKLTESKTSATETSAIATMKMVAGAQAQFREADRDQDSHLDYATDMAELSTAGLIDNVLGGGSKSGYLFSLSGSTYDWQATATPANVHVGKRRFYVDTSAVVRFSVSGTPNADSPPIGE